MKNNNTIHFSLTQMEYVLSVEKFKHFGKAAKACSVTQPTLSMQIQKLEEDLGVILFDRSKKPILVTEIGEKIIEQIKTIMMEAKKIEIIIQNNDSKVLAGELRLGIIPTITPYVLPLLLKQMEKTYPEISLVINEMQTDHIIEALQNDELDVGLLATPLKINKMMEIALYYEPFYVLCQKKHPLTKLKKIKHNLLGGSDIWLLEEGHCLRHQMLDVCSLKLKNTPNKKFLFESGNIETLKNLISVYGGYTLVPHLSLTQIPPNTTPIAFELPIPSREIGLAYRREHYKQNLIEALGDSILESIPLEIKKLRKKDLDIIPII